MASGKATASDLPQAAGSPAAGITFDDRPLMLPVQRNFQMAMLTASSELGRSCGHMEAYGWRMGANEQQRVNQIFNNTVDRMRAQGFVVETKAPNSVSRDVTMFTADRPDKHLLFMWSAGEIGLVMVLCETSAPLASTSRTLTAPDETTGPARKMHEVSQPLRGGDSKLPLTRTGKQVVENFSPVGDWVGTYTCTQGTTGGTLHIASLKGDQFEGTLRFYPTPKNPYVPTGKYNVYGEYDRDTNRILINPGKWITRPPNYFNTIIIGSFDPVAKTFSGYFQGINGCTSFEARYSANASEIEGLPAAKSVAVTKSKKKAPTGAAKPKAKKAKTGKTETSKPADAKSSIELAPATTTTPGLGPSEVKGISVGDHVPLPPAPKADAPKAQTTTPAIPQAPAPEPRP